MYETAQAMVAMAVEKGWPSIQIIDGSAHMKWAIWMGTEDNDIALKGFEPTEKEKEKRSRIKRTLTTQAEVRAKVSPGRRR